MAALNNSRIWSVFTGTAHAAPSNYTSQGVNNRLIRANQQSESTVYDGLADSYWVNGLDESRFLWHIAYLICDNEGVPQLSTKTGTQTTPPPHSPGTTNELGETNNEYIRFKAGADNGSFIAAIQHIKELNEAAGNVLNNGSFPNPSDSADVWKSWAEANLDCYTNFQAITTTTTEEPTDKYLITQCGGTNETATMAYTGALEEITPDPGSGTILIVGALAENIASVSDTAPLWVRALSSEDSFRVIGLAMGDVDFIFSGTEETNVCSEG